MDDLNGLTVAIACERYTVLPGRRVQTSQPHAQRVCGAVQGIATLYGVPCRLQAAGTAKKIASPKLLKRIGWWHPTKDMHQVNATQNILLYMATEWPDYFAELIGI